MRPASDKTTGSGLANVLAVLFLALVLVGLAGRFWASDKAFTFTGPTHITISEEGLWLYTSQQLVQLSRSGELLQTVALEQAGLKDDPIDLEWIPGAGLLLAGQQPAHVRLCQTDRWNCRVIGDPAIEAIKRQFKIVPLDPPGQWLLSDAAGDALWWLDEQSGQLEQALPADSLAGANGLASGPDGYFWIADTDHRRIVELLPGESGSYAVGREHSAVNDLTIKRRFYPMMLTAGADGYLWVAQAAAYSLAESDLVLYHPQLGAEAVIALPDRAYPTDLAAMGDDVLVTDMDQFRVYRVDTETRQSDIFGDETFQALMSHNRDQRYLYENLSTLALWLTIAATILMVITLVRVTPREKRWTQPLAIDMEQVAESVPGVTGIHWLQPARKLVWLGSSLVKIYYGLFVLLCGIAGALYALSCAPSSLPEDIAFSANLKLAVSLLLMCLAVAAFIPMMHFSTRVLRRRIGTDGRQVILKLENDRQLVAAPEQLSWNDRIILFEGFSFPIRTGRAGSLYQEGEVETWLLPLLRQAERLGEWQILKRQWRSRDQLLLSTAAAIGFLLVLTVLVSWSIRF